MEIIKNLILKIREYVSKQERLALLKKRMEDSTTYEEWSKYANELDILTNKIQWKQKNQSSLYDYKRIITLIAILKKKKELRDINGLIHYLRNNLVKNLYNINNPYLYLNSNLGTKYLIEEFQSELSSSLDFVANFPDKSFPLFKKNDFFSEIKHSYGKTAILLSGGASFGMYHIGTVLTLMENNLLPKIICGSSAGSIIASILCCNSPENIREVNLI